LFSNEKRKTREEKKTKNKKGKLFYVIEKHLSVCFSVMAYFSKHFLNCFAPKKNDVF
jgi:hypothetical protein